MLPTALLRAGLATRLDARTAGRVEVPAHAIMSDEATQVLNAAEIEQFSISLADHLEPLLETGDFPLVLGGDCSILLGNLLALRRRGRAGLFFIDGHADFYQPAAEPNGEAASMELAFATGRGPDLVANIEGRTPLVRDRDVVVFGRRDAAEAERHGSQRIEDTQIEVFDINRISRDGVRLCVDEALQRLADAPDGIWVHLDADVLDDRVMPAVDYRMPGGLGTTDLRLALFQVLRSGRVVGMDVTIFNPTLDPTGRIAHTFTDLLVSSLEGLPC